LSCGTAFGQGATDLEPGVHVDPGSPAAKEYALPLNQARRTGAAPASHESPPEAALFGAGIKPPGSSGPPRSGPGSGGRASTGRRISGATRAAGTALSESDPGTLPPAVLRAARSQGAGGGADSLLVLLGGGVVILVLGGFGGTVLRHNRRPTSSRPAPPRPTPSG
jgi:hypothetical protein